MRRTRARFVFVVRADRRWIRDRCHREGTDERRARAGRRRGPRRTPHPCGNAPRGPASGGQPAQQTAADLANLLRQVNEAMGQRGGEGRAGARRRRSRRSRRRRRRRGGAGGGHTRVISGADPRARRAARSAATQVVPPPPGPGGGMFGTGPSAYGEPPRGGGARRRRRTRRPRRTARLRVRTAVDRARRTVCLPVRRCGVHLGSDRR